MAPTSPSTASSHDSRDNSPMPFDRLSHSFAQGRRSNMAQTSPFLELPKDLFKCVLDYLDRDAAWALKRLCKGMASSDAVDELLYKYPIQLNDVLDVRLCDWKYRNMGVARWNIFKDSINDNNRRYVQKLAMSHWMSIEDFRWVEANLPSLIALDLSSIKDFVWTPEVTWTWKELAIACPTLFSRVEELEVANWADYTAHSRIEYSYAYNDYRFKPKFRLSRRRDGGSVAAMIFPLCTKLQTLAIRERYSGYHTWNEWEVHQRVCCLVDGVSNHCPPTLTKLRVHDYDLNQAPYRSLLSTDAYSWPNITDIEIGLYTWMEDRRDRDVIGPIPHRVTQGHHHREEEEAFDDKTFDSCKREHLTLGNHVVQSGVGTSFEDLLLGLRAITQKYPTVNIRPLKSLRDMTLHPFHLVNINQRRSHVLQQNAQQLPDPVSNSDIQEALRWLSESCDWKPILAWDNMMCDVFPANLEPTRTFLPKPEVLSRIQSMVSTLRSLNIPIRLSIGDKNHKCPGNLDGSLYFGDYKVMIGDDENRHELFAPTQARFSLSGIAHMVDELIIQYPLDMPSIHGWARTGKRPTEAEKELLAREMKGWRRFWERYAQHFTNLKKLTANVPADIYADWGRCEGLRAVLADPRWDMLEVDNDAIGGEHSFLGSYFPFPSSARTRLSLPRRRSRIKFVQRVFFRRDDAPLQITSPHADRTEEEREDREILDVDVFIGVDQEFGEHRFWPLKRADKKAKANGKQHGEKRKIDDVAEGDTAATTNGDDVERGAKKAKVAAD